MPTFIEIRIKDLKKMRKQLEKELGGIEIPKEVLEASEKLGQGEKQKNEGKNIYDSKQIKGNIIQLDDSEIKENRQRISQIDSEISRLKKLENNSVQKIKQELIEFKDNTISDVEPSKNQKRKLSAKIKDIEGKTYGELIDDQVEVISKKNLETPYILLRAIETDLTLVERLAPQTERKRTDENFIKNIQLEERESKADKAGWKEVKPRKDQGIGIDLSKVRKGEDLETHGLFSQRGAKTLRNEKRTVEKDDSSGPKNK